MADVAADRDPAGAPRRTPEVTVGFSGSNWVPFLLQLGRPLFLPTELFDFGQCPGLTSKNYYSIVEGQRPMKQVRTRILIADGATARVLEREGPGHGLYPIKGRVFHGDHSSTDDLMPDQIGRSFSSTGVTRFAIESHSDLHRKLNKEVARQMADVPRQVGSNSAPTIDSSLWPLLPRLAICAALFDQARPEVTAGMAKDLTKTPNTQVAELSDQCVFEPAFPE